MERSCGLPCAATPLLPHYPPPRGVSLTVSRLPGSARAHTLLAKRCLAAPVVRCNTALALLRRPDERPEVAAGRRLFLDKGDIKVCVWGGGGSFQFAGLLCAMPRHVAAMLFLGSWGTSRCVRGGTGWGSMHRIPALHNASSQPGSTSFFPFCTCMHMLTRTCTCMPQLLLLLLLSSPANPMLTRRVATRVPAA